MIGYSFDYFIRYYSRRELLLLCIEMRCFMKIRARSILFFFIGCIIGHYIAQSIIQYVQL